MKSQESQLQAQDHSSHFKSNLFTFSKNAFSEQIYEMKHSRQNSPRYQEELPIKQLQGQNQLISSVSCSQGYQNSEIDCPIKINQTKNKDIQKQWTLEQSPTMKQRYKSKRSLHDSQTIGEAHQWSVSSNSDLLARKDKDKKDKSKLRDSIRSSYPFLDIQNVKKEELIVQLRNNYQSQANMPRKKPISNPYNSGDMSCCFRVGTVLLLFQCSSLSFVAAALSFTLYLLTLYLFLIIPYFLMWNCIRNGRIKLPRTPHQRPHQFSPNILLFISYYPNNPGQHQRICQECQIYQNSKISHCRRCQTCHIGFDHYCSWLGTCIFEANYRMFIGFVICVFFLFLLIIVISFVTLSGVVEIEQFENKGIIVGFSSVALVQSMFSIFFCGYVLIYQIWVRSKGKTTKQHFSGQLDMPGNNLLCNSICGENNSTQKLMRIVNDTSQTTKQKSTFILSRNNKIEPLEIYGIMSNHIRQEGDNNTIFKLKPVEIDSDYQSVSNSNARESMGQQQISRQSQGQEQQHESSITNHIIDLSNSNIIKISNSEQGNLSDDSSSDAKTQ